MSSPPHPLCHFGMAGWFHIRGVPTAYYKAKANAKAKSVGEDEWPPKYWKFALKTQEDGTEAALVDFRRFGRVRLIDCPAEDIRKVSPLLENGPDPVIDKDLVTVDWLKDLCGKKRVPVKALLLDQANISGIGNWVGDELLYNAKIHPEQYANTLSAVQIKQLHESIHYVCGLACELLADSERFPEEWLFRHREWKGKKGESHRLPNGEKVVYMTVGGRTSMVVPGVQKKTGPVAGDVKAEDVEHDGKDEDVRGKAKGKGAKGGKRKADDGDEEEAKAEEPAEEEQPKPSRKGRKSNPRMPVIDADTKPANESEEMAKRSITKRQVETNGLSPKKPTAKKGRQSGVDKEAVQTNGNKDESKALEEQPEVKARKGRTSKKQKVEADAGGSAGRGKKAEKTSPTTERRRSGRLSGR